MSGVTTTPNLQLNKPIVGQDENLWGDHLNQNADKIDAAWANLQAETIATAPVIGGTLTLDVRTAGVFRVTLSQDIGVVSLLGVTANRVSTRQLELLGDGTQRSVNFGAWAVVTGTSTPTSALGRKDIYDIRTDGVNTIVWLTAQNVPS